MRLESLDCHLAPPHKLTAGVSTFANAESISTSVLGAFAGQASTTSGDVRYAGESGVATRYDKLAAIDPGLALTSIQVWRSAIESTPGFGATSIERDVGQQLHQFCLAGASDLFQHLAQLRAHGSNGNATGGGDLFRGFADGESSHHPRLRWRQIEQRSHYFDGWAGGAAAGVSFIEHSLRWRTFLLRCKTPWGDSLGSGGTMRRCI
jgi:hypothetical protein